MQYGDKGKQRATRIGADVLLVRCISFPLGITESSQLYAFRVAPTFSQERLIYYVMPTVRELQSVELSLDSWHLSQLYY